MLHDLTSFSSPSDPPISTAAAVGLGAGITATLGLSGYAVWRTVKPWSLRDSGTQMPDIDPLALTPGRRTPPNYIHGETGDPSEFLSVTPTGRVKTNARARFF